MTTNELKKGDWVLLANGWKAQIADNQRGNVRMAKVFGLYTEIGSVYSHDIVWKCAEDPGNVTDRTLIGGEEIEHTKGQLKLKASLARMGF